MRVSARPVSTVHGTGRCRSWKAPSTPARDAGRRNGSATGRDPSATIWGDLYQFQQHIALLIICSECAAILREREPLPPADSPAGRRDVSRKPQ